ncbi:FecR domain-containing protein [Patescibacteria group bacterium]|nr:FecR domain-containing protein [Patescibacteria group bacterium]
MYQIQLSQNETWLKAFLKRIGLVMPSEAFVAQAKIRLIERISMVRKPAWAWLTLTKRLVASTLVMIIAVTATLFFVEGGQTVSASEDTYIEVITGTAAIKHADKLIWDEITGQIEVAAGDLIRLNEASEAVIHFFDDTELRLAGNSSLLISQLAVSPTFSSQGIIETSLYEGNAWVQTLNVDDGYANFTLSTRDAIVQTLNSTFNVTTSTETPTSVRVFSNDVQLVMLNPETRETIKTFALKSDQQVTLTKFPQTSTITEQDKIEEWVQSNLQKDYEHLVTLRENGFNKLKLSAGTLPGNMLYPIKQAKERLKLAFSFDQEALTETQIEIANNRLSEAIILLQKGERQKAMESLMAYQSIARQVAEKENDDFVTYKLITPHQKALVASLPTTAPIVMVKDALNQAEELLIDDPVELEKVKLKNSIEHLEDVAYFIQSGDINSAKEALISHELVITSTIDAVSNIEDPAAQEEAFRAILSLRNEELELMSALAQQVGMQPSVDTQFAAMLENASAETEEEVERVIALITPIMPNVLIEQIEQAPVSHIDELVAKIYIYKSWQGQQNQINRLLGEEGKNAKSTEFLVDLRNGLDGRARDYLNTKILELERTAKLNKDKAVQRKIDRAQRLRDNEE